MKNVVKVEGKAKNVFKYIELLNRHNGKMTIGELAKRNTAVRIELR